MADYFAYGDQHVSSQTTSTRTRMHDAGYYECHSYCGHAGGQRTVLLTFRITLTRLPPAQRASRRGRWMTRCNACATCTKK